MTKTLLFATALIAAIATPAIASDTPVKRRFVRDGETYVYTIAKKTDRVVLTGRRFPADSAFELVIRGDRVTGTSGGVAVNFTVPDAQASITSTDMLASR